jgi:hypothetical protein
MLQTKVLNSHQEVNSMKISILNMLAIFFVSSVSSAAYYTCEFSESGNGGYSKAMFKLDTYATNHIELKGLKRGCIIEADDDRIEITIGDLLPDGSESFVGATIARVRSKGETELLVAESFSEGRPTCSCRPTPFKN